MSLDVYLNESYQKRLKLAGCELELLLRYEYSTGKCMRTLRVWVCTTRNVLTFVNTTAIAYRQNSAFLR